MNTSDRELLEDAAKAAGMYSPRYVTDGFALGWALPNGISTEFGPTRQRLWNPLINSADALDLAVKLGIDVMHTNIHSPQVHAMADYDVACIEDSATDPCAATRRAIVRAAAEIGKEMK